MMARSCGGRRGRMMGVKVHGCGPTLMFGSAWMCVSGWMCGLTWNVHNGLRTRIVRALVWELTLIAAEHRLIPTGLNGKRSRERVKQP
jgi:hypothetical protein